MFCPNCGTQNSETASTCIKCGFNLKGAAAPKFKGTMLMTNQPAGAPAPGAPPGPPRPAAPPAPAAPVVGQGPQGLAGTVIGVPPAGLGASAGPPGAPPPPPGAPPPGAPPPGQPAFGGAAGGPGGYSPAGPPQGGVNPLGGTMAIDQLPGFNPPPAPPAQPGFPPPGGGPPGGGFGAPQPDPNAGGFGGPPAYGQPPPGGYVDPSVQASGGFGQPQAPGGYGQPAPGGYGQPDPMMGQPGMGGQPGYGQQPQMGYGGAPGGFGAPGGGAPMAAPGQFGAAPMGGGYGGGGMGGAGPVGQVRNPVMTLVISLFCCLYGIYQQWTMLNELQAYTRDDSFKPWYMFIPLLNLYFLLFKVPEQVTKAKQMAGSRNPQASSIVVYFFIFYYALAKDLNEVWQPQS
ncbi:MAG: zinc ribbon domain-containing protein [Polyangiaceae bacterium]|nr:zinc ribbon domain-containing protein [Polyangiaceae bacterium]